MVIIDPNALLTICCRIFPFENLTNQRESLFIQILFFLWNNFPFRKSFQTVCKLRTQPHDSFQIITSTSIQQPFLRIVHCGIKIVELAAQYGQDTAPCGNIDGFVWIIEQSIYFSSQSFTVIRWPGVAQKLPNTRWIFYPDKIRCQRIAALCKTYRNLHIITVLIAQPHSLIHTVWWAKRTEKFVTNKALKIAVQCMLLCIFLTRRIF